MPETLSITVNKDNFTTSLIKKTNRCVVNILDESAPFEFFKTFGMQFSKDVDKFKDVDCETTQSGIKTNTKYSAGYFEMEITNTIDMGTHYLFVVSQNLRIISIHFTPYLSLFIIINYSK